MGAMKAMKSIKKKAVRAMTQTDMFSSLATKTGLEKKAIKGCVEALTSLATTEVKKSGKFTIPGLCMLKTRVKAARKAGTTTAFGKVIKVKARAAKTIVKAYPVSALKKSI